MALEKTTVSINLGQGLDQKYDEKVADPKTFEQIFDMRWDKLNQSSKRFGTRRFSQDVITDFPDPLSIDASSVPSGIYAHKDQLLLQNKGELYSYSEDREAWRFVGHQPCVDIQTERIVSGPESVVSPAMGDVGNIRIVLYVTLRSLGFAGFESDLRYSVIDKTTGAYIVNDVLVRDNSAAANTILFPGVVTFANSAFLIWQEGANVKICPVSLADGSFGAITNLKTDAAVQTSTTSTFAGEGCLDWVYTNKPGVGERAFIIYKSATSYGSIFCITNAGTVDSSMANTAWNTTFIRGFGIYYNDTADRLFVSRQSTTDTIQVRAFSFDGASMTLVYSDTCIFPAISGGNVVDNNIHAMTFEKNPEDLTETVIFYDGVLIDSVTNSGVTNTFLRTDISRAIFGANAKVDDYAPVCTGGVFLTGKAFRDTERNTIYLPAVYSSSLQGAHFLIDWKRGYYDESVPAMSAGVYAKFNAQFALSVNSSLLPRVLEPESRKFVLPCLTRGAVTSNSRFSTGIAVSNSSLTQALINLDPEYSSQAQFSNSGTYFSGGFLSCYDGAQINEHNFFIEPEYLTAVFSTGTAKVALSITQGTAGTPESTAMTFYGGVSLVNMEGVVGNHYITFDTPSTDYYIWFTVDNVGTNPAVGGRTAIGVIVNSWDTPAQIAAKVADRVNAIASGVATAVANGDVVTVTNVANGVVPDASAANFVNPTTGPAAGTYQYVAVWRWIDVNGQVVRSAPSVPVAVTKTGTEAVYITIYCPALTNRLTTDVQIELYRTVDGGATFHALFDELQDTRWNYNQGIGFIDTLSDADIRENEVLYTTGGVLGNYQIPACNSVSNFKNRLVVSGMDDSSVYYSKTALAKEVVNFAEELFIATDDNGQKIVGHAQLDDKLIVGKEKSIVYYAGDGANDTGQNSSFSQPVLIASDTGFLNPKSVALVPNGIWFKSKMGLQLLTRATEVVYLGMNVKDYNEFAVMKAQVLTDDEKVREVRFALSGDDVDETIVYDYLANKWAIYTNYDATDSCIWKGQYAFVDSDAFVRIEDKSIFVDRINDDPADDIQYDPEIQTVWLKIKNVQDFQRVWRLMVLGDLKSAHSVEIEVSYDFDEVNFDPYLFDSSNVDDEVYQFEIHLKRQKCDAIRVKLRMVADAGTQECASLTDMSFIVGTKKSLNKLKAGKKL